MKKHTDSEFWGLCLHDSLGKQRTMRVMPLVKHGTISSVRSDDLIAFFYSCFTVHTCALLRHLRRQALANFEAGYSRGKKRQREYTSLVIGALRKRHHEQTFYCNIGPLCRGIPDGSLFWVLWKRISLGSISSCWPAGHALSHDWWGVIALAPFRGISLSWMCRKLWHDKHVFCVL